MFLRGENAFGGRQGGDATNAANAPCLPCYDGNGNIAAWVHGGNGSLIERREYDSFGNMITVYRLAADAALHAKLFYGFSTKWRDPESELLYYGYRYYNPNTQRWLNRDPIQEAGGINLYGFVGNDGVNRWDYLGMKWSSINGAEAIALTVAERQNPGKLLKENPKHPCCNIIPKMPGSDCITYAAGVIECGYLLGNNKDMAKKVKGASSNGNLVARVLQKDGWKGIAYARDLFYVYSPFTDPVSDPRPKTGDYRHVVYGKHIHDVIDYSARVGDYHGIKIHGSVTQFSPRSGHDTSSIVNPTQSISALESEYFSFLDTANSWHTAIMLKNTVYDGSPSLGKDKKTPHETNGFASWASRYYASGNGYIMLPPDVNINPIYKVDLNLANGLLRNKKTTLVDVPLP